MAALRRERREQILPLALHINAGLNAAYAGLRTRTCVRTLACVTSGASAQRLMRRLKEVNWPSGERASSSIGNVCLFIVAFRRMSNERARLLAWTAPANCLSQVPRSPEDPEDCGDIGGESG